MARKQLRTLIRQLEELEPRRLLSAGELRIVTYNIANSANALRDPAGLGTILHGIGDESYFGLARPIDVLLLQEVNRQDTTTQAVVKLLNDIYGADTYQRGFLEANDTPGGSPAEDTTQGIVYNTHEVELKEELFVGESSSAGQPRRTLRYLVHPIGFNTDADFYIYNSHYRSGPLSDNRDDRTAEAIAIRTNADSLVDGSQILYVGDFNTLTSNEVSYQVLLAGGPGQAFDPLNRPGDWRDDAEFRDVFTQAPAVSPPSPLNGGGLDDRFDFQLFTSELQDTSGLDYIPDSYHAFGNDGNVAVNGNINDNAAARCSSSSWSMAALPNCTAILDLLTTVSDHLPVVADYHVVKPAVNFSTSSQSRTESVGSLSVTVELSHAISEAVTVPFSVSASSTATAGTDYIILPSSPLVIPPGSLSASISIVVTNDRIDEDNETIVIALGSPQKAMLGSVSGHTLTVLDDDTRDVIIADSGGSTDVTEDGTTDTYTVVLATQPTANVAISVSPASQITVAPTSLTFTSFNWNTPQSVTVTAVNDSSVEGNHTGTISHIASSSDSNYNGLAIASVTAKITDNDSAGVTIAESEGTTNVSEGGTVDNYTVVLTAMPTANVTIKISPDSQVTVSPTSLTFTNTNWNTAQTVTVTAVNDDVAEGNHTGTIVHTATSNDSNYNGIGIDSVRVDIADNDLADTTPPSLQLVPSDQFVEATSAAGTVVTYTLPTATDDIDLNPTVRCLPASGSVFRLGTTRVTCTATDGSGNASSAMFDVTVQDTTSPQLTNVSPDLLREAVAPIGAIVTYVLPRAIDEVDPIPTARCTPATGSTFSIGATTVTCTARDFSNNSTTQTFTITVQDTTPPSLTLPSDIVREADPSGSVSISFNASATDSVDGLVPVICNPVSGASFAVGRTRVDCKAQDSWGNSRSGSFTVTVLDPNAPTVLVPSDLTIEATGPVGAIVLFSVSAVDIQDGAGVSHCYPSSGDVFSLGLVLVTCSATDSQGNVGMASFRVTVRDTTAPTIATVQLPPFEAESASGVVVDFAMPTASDTVDQAPNVQCDRQGGTTFPLGTSTVTCIASDYSGNSAVATVSIVVRDTTPPRLTVPADSVQKVASPSEAVVYAVNAVDLVSGVVTPSCDRPSGQPFILGTTVVTCSAHDSSGNSTARSFRVTVQDAVGPTVTVETDHGKKRVDKVLVRFSEQVTGVGVQIMSSYTLVKGKSKRVPLGLPVYDPQTQTVTLTPLKPLSRSDARKTRLIISAAGLTDLAGNLLDGDGDGQPGGDFERIL